MKKLFLICCLLIGLTLAGYAQTHPATSDPAEKAKGLQKQLKLTDAQTTKVATIYTESASKFKKIKEAEKGNTNKMLVDIAPLRTETIKKIKAVLTPAQKVKYDKLVKDTKSTGGNGWSDGWSPAASN